VLGDQSATDLAFGRVLGARTALVLSGITTAEDLPVEPAPDVVAADVGALVTAELAART
jgi:ribonucleotide monophosphatase NagD (HAD superfamily)